MQRGKNGQNALERAMLQLLGRGYGAPPQTLPPRRSVASRLVRGLRPINRLSMSRNGEIKSWQPYT